MSFETFVASHTFQADFGDWLVEIDLLNPLSAAEVLRFSRHGSVTTAAMTIDGVTVPAHTPFRMRLISAPTWSQSLWSQGNILARSFPNYGTALLNNRDGGLDQYAPRTGYTWVDRRCRTYYGPARKPEQLAADIAKVVDATMGRPSFNLATVEIPLLGYESRFDVMSSKRVYRGTSYMLGLSGVKQVSYGTPAAVNITGDLSLEAWVWLNSSMSGATVPVWGWIGGTNWPWRVNIRSNGTLRLSCTIGGGTELVTTTAALAFFKPYHLAIDVDGRDVVVRIWDDDAQTLTTETFTNAFSNATRDGQAGGGVYAFNNDDALFDVTGDEMRVWNVARTASEHEADRFREIPDGSVPASLVHYARMNDGTGTAVTDSAAGGNNGTISGAGTGRWLWAYEGASELSGTPKPDLWGIRFGIAPVLVNPFDNGYQVAGAGEIEAIDSVQEGGNDSYIYDTNATSLFAFITATVASGHVLRYLPRALFRLGDAPTLPLSVNGRGYNTGSLGYVETPADLLYTVSEQRGPTLNPATDYDDDSFDDLNAITSAPSGVWLPAPVNLMDLNDVLAASAGAWWGYLRGATKLHVERFSGPSVTADHTFDTRHIISEPQELVWQPVSEVVVRYRRNDVVLTEDQVAAAIVGTAGWQTYLKDWLEVRRGGPLVGSRTITVETALYNEIDAARLADHLLVTLQGEKQGWSVAVKAVGLLVSMGDTITLEWRDQQGNARLGLDGGTKYLVLSVNDQRQDGRVGLEVLSA